MEKNKNYKKGNPNKIKAPYKKNIKYYGDMIFFFDAPYMRNYKTHSQLKQWSNGELRKRPKDSWKNEKQVNCNQYKSWKKNSKREKQYTIEK